MKNDGFKSCSKCGSSKPVDLFYKRSRSSDGLASWCKDCFRECNQGWYEKNKKKSSDRAREYRDRNKERLAEYSKKYYQENRDARSEYGRRYREANRSKENKRQAEYRSKRKKTDPAYALVCRTRDQARLAMRGCDCDGFFRHMPYTKDEFASHLLSTIPEGYTEEDACDGSKLHIDHIRPVSSFKLTGEVDDEFIACWALDNLQLLPASDNLKKGASLDWPFN